MTTVYTTKVYTTRVLKNGLITAWGEFPAAVEENCPCCNAHAPVAYFETVEMAEKVVALLNNETKETK